MIDESPTSATGVSRGALQTLSVASVFVGASLFPPPISVAALVAGALLWVRSRSAGPSVVDSEHRWSGAAAAVIVAGSQLYPIGPVPGVIVAHRPVLLGLGLTAAATLFLLGSSPAGRRVALTVACAAAVIPTVLVLATEWQSPVGTDAYRAHLEAGDAIRDGESPYGKAVRFVEGNPWDGEESIIEGYPYPPVAALVYGGLAMVGDPRLASAVSWLGVLVWLGRRALIETRSGHTAVGLFVLTAILPIWGVVLYAGWTEPLSLVLFVGAAALWGRSVVASSVLLGLALASKQYFVFLAPVVLLFQDERRLQRSLLVGSTVLAALLPGLLLGPGEFMAATVGNLADIPLRPDSQSLSGALMASGITVALPNWSWAAVAAGFAVVIAGRFRGLPGFSQACPVTLGFAFLTGQAFPNYWVLVGGLLAVAAVVESSTPGGESARLGGWSRLGAVHQDGR